MAIVIIIASFAFVGFSMWLRERSESRWDKRMNDLLNRKMARDFYDYVEGTKIIEQLKGMTPAQLRMLEIEKMEKEIRERGEKTIMPNFINTQHADTIPRKQLDME